MQSRNGWSRFWAARAESSLELLKVSEGLGIAAS
jgi:hypothetical protein